jgi:hypothetical protein
LLSAQDRVGGRANQHFGDYFGAEAGAPLEYREKNWDDDQFCRDVEGGYWPRGV